MTTIGTAILAAIIAGGTVTALSVAEPAPAVIAEHAVAIDGDTLRIGAARVRLAYIDAPEKGQTCTDAWRTSWACGEASARSLARMIDRDPLVSCQAKSTDRYGRTVAVCQNSMADLGARQVATGMAIRYERYAGNEYRDEETAAKAERLGVWSGTFEVPEQYRRRNKR